MLAQKTEHEAAERFSHLLAQSRPVAEPRTEPRSSLTDQMAELVHYKDTLLREVHHRVGNSLQIIASVLAMDARQVQSAEARRHLQNAHRRILAVATMQRQLQMPRDDCNVEIAAYLDHLAETLAGSVVTDPARIVIDVQSDMNNVAPETAMNLGLIVTELVINALKHAFLADTEGRITIRYRVQGYRWQLSVSDNGNGMQVCDQIRHETGLGKTIVAVLVRQIGGEFEASTTVGGSGNTLSIKGVHKPLRDDPCAMAARQAHE